MQTLIKWPGGKTSELAVIKELMPSEYDRYFEPFFGGGALFFDLPPRTAVINDVSVNLMQFYALIKSGDASFRTCMDALRAEWASVREQAYVQARALLPLFCDDRQGAEHESIVGGRLLLAIEDFCDAVTKPSRLIADKDAFAVEVTRTVEDKYARTLKGERKRGGILSDADVVDNLATGSTSGYYMYLRSVHNGLERTDGLFVSPGYRAAVFYFVREFCYGSMFRYNKHGDFNIPYGGIAYNTKDFDAKVERLFCEGARERLKHAEVRCEDFERVLDEAKQGDFIFLDPPYDTEFSDYEKRAFGEAEQTRLAAALGRTQAKFLLIIKNSPLIESLYRNKGYRIYEFDNKYAYCVRGRNDRNAVHLIVTNYALGE